MYAEDFPRSGVNIFLEASSYHHCKYELPASTILEHPVLLSLYNIDFASISNQKTPEGKNHVLSLIVSQDSALKESRSHGSAQNQNIHSMT